MAKEKGPRPVIDKKKCNGCKTCIEICPMNIFVMAKGKSAAKKPEECIGCRACEAQCSVEAIKIVE